jgi:competence protein ComEC
LRSSNISLKLNSAPFLYQKNVWKPLNNELVTHVYNASNITVNNTNNFSLKRVVDLIRLKILQNIQQTNLLVNSKSLLIALSIGERGFINYQNLQNVYLSGFGHLLAISGLHLTLIIGTIFFVLNRFFSIWFYHNQNITKNFN